MRITAVQKLGAVALLVLVAPVIAAITILKAQELPLDIDKVFSLAVSIYVIAAAIVVAVSILYAIVMTYLTYRDYWRD